MIDTIHEPARNTLVVDRGDVVVVGAGPGGIAAALGAARNNADTVLIEKESSVGGYAGPGLMTVGWNLDEPGSDGLKVAKELFHRIDEMGGFTTYRKLYETTLKDCPNPNPLFHNPDWKGIVENRAVYVWDAEIFKLAALEMLEKAGVRVVLNTLMVDTIVENDTILAVVTESKSGRLAVEGKIFVDTTKDADVVAKSGAPFIDAGDEKGVSLPIGIMFKMSGVDFSRLWAYQKDDCYLSRIIEKAQAEGQIHKRKQELDYNVFPGDRGFDPEKWVYSGHPLLEISPLVENDEMLGWGGPLPPEWKLCGTKAADLTRAEMYLRKQILAEVRFAKKYIPGFEKAYLTTISHLMGVRESRHPIGEYVLTIDDIRQKRKFDDAVIRRRPYSLNKGVTDELYEVPYRSFLPKKIHNLILGGEIISTDREAFLHERCILLCIDNGEIAGIAAGLSAKNSVKPKDLDYEVLKESSGSYKG